MSTEIEISSKLPFGPGDRRALLTALERAIEAILGDAGHGSGFTEGPSTWWSIYIDVMDDTPGEVWVERFIPLLRERGVPPDTIVRWYPEEWDDNEPGDPRLTRRVHPEGETVE